MLATCVQQPTQSEWFTKALLTTRFSKKPVTAWPKPKSSRSWVWLTTRLTSTGSDVKSSKARSWSSARPTDSVGGERQAVLGRMPANARLGTGEQDIADFIRDDPFLLVSS